MEKEQTKLDLEELKARGILEEKDGQIGFSTKFIEAFRAILEKEKDTGKGLRDWLLRGIILAILSICEPMEKETLIRYSLLVYTAFYIFLPASVVEELESKKDLGWKQLS